MEVDSFRANIGSPLGWHNTKSQEYTTTRGNNGFSVVNLDGDLAVDFMELYSPDGNSTLNFDFPFDTTDHDLSNSLDAAATQLFYTTNMVYSSMPCQSAFTGSLS